MPDALATTLDFVTAWAGCDVAHTVITGGLSNHVARVESATGERWVLRVLDQRVVATGLGIPLEQEIANTRRAAEAGVGPRVLRELPGALLLEYIDGRTLDVAAVRDPKLTPAIAAACRRLHRGPRFVNDFSIFRKLDELLALCRGHGLPLPAGYEDTLPLAAQIEAALARRPMPAVPCHNDLLAQNLLLAGGRVRIIDYQLSGNNDPAFDLGDLAAEADYDPDQTARLVRAYLHGPPGDVAAPVAGVDPDEFAARVRLYLIMANLTWTLWFAVHHGLVQRAAGPDGDRAAVGPPAAEPGRAAGAAESGRAAQSVESGRAVKAVDPGPSAGAAGVDYAAEAAVKFGRAVRDLGAPELGRLIDAVRAHHPSPGPERVG